MGTKSNADAEVDAWPRICDRSVAISLLSAKSRRGPTARADLLGMSTIKKTVLAVAALAALGLGGSALAGAAGQSTSTTTKKTTTPSKHGSGETALTGDTADRVQAAALAKVDGTVLRVETDRDGVYEAHIRKADGTEVEVQVNNDYTVAAVNTMGGHP